MTSSYAEGFKCSQLLKRSEHGAGFTSDRAMIALAEHSVSGRGRK